MSFLVYFFDPLREVEERYNGRFEVSPSSICPPPEPVCRKRKRSSDENGAAAVSVRAPQQWSHIRALVAEDIAQSAAQSFNADRDLCKRGLLHCKQKIATLFSLYEAINQMNGPDGSDEDDSIDSLQKLSVVEQDPTLIFTRSVYCESDSTWDSVLGRLAIPGRSAFRMGDIGGSLRSLARSPECRGRYKVIVADPPWPNRSVRRGGKYASMSLDSIRLLGPAVRGLADPACCVLALWVTNDPAVIAFAKESLLPAWGFTFVSTWWWLKVAASGQPVCGTGGSHKNPYELAIIGFRSEQKLLEFEKPSSDDIDLFANADGCGADPLLSLGRRAHFPYSSSEAHPPAPAPAPVPWRCVVSVPLRHSWKPPLHSLLLEVVEQAVRNLDSEHSSTPLGTAHTAGRLPEDHCTLELFASELRSCCTSVGNECLLFQQVESNHDASASIEPDGFLSILSGKGDKQIDLL